jgi:hypothetical protein
MGNTSDHANQEIDGEYFRPKASSFVIAFVVTEKRNGLQCHNQQSQTHRELREEIVIGDGEGEMQTMQEQCIHK